MPAPDISLELAATVVGGVLTVFGGLLRYIWQEMKVRIQEVREALEGKADHGAMATMEVRFNADIKRVEDRQNRDLEGLRQEMQAMERRISEKIDMVVQLLRGQ